MYFLYTPLTSFRLKVVVYLLVGVCEKVAAGLTIEVLQALRG